MEVFKTNGPPTPLDPILTTSVELLPEDSKKIIESYGTLSDFLLSSLLFRTYVGGAKLGLKQERNIISETIHQTQQNFPSLGELAAIKKPMPKPAVSVAPPAPAPTKGPIKNKPPAKSDTKTHKRKEGKIQTLGAHKEEQKQLLCLEVLLRQ